MAKAKRAYGPTASLIAVFTILICFLGGRVLATLTDGDDSDRKRADIIQIDTLKKFGDLSKPEVVFLHDLHTRTLQEMGKDCTACHLSKERPLKIPGTFKDAVENIDPLSPKFKRLEDTARREVMDTYHTFCIQCHTDMKAKGQLSGPVTCGECHKPRDLESVRQPMGFDKSLHYRHVKAQDKKCERCHHAYNEEKKELYYAKGKEGTCRYCHKEQKEENRISMREASHLDCINCHRDTLAKNKLAGPVECSGCHLESAQKKIQKLEEVPRMERNQPDATLVSTGIEDVEKYLSGVVPFNHKAHEEYNDTCRVCHHAAMDKCSTCHTLNGIEKGGFVKLKRSFHQIDADQSCMGCHAAKLSDPKCSGCHVFSGRNEKRSEASCLKCHEDASPEIITALKKNDEEALKKLAHQMIAARPETLQQPIDDKDIPEKVIIDEMVDNYEPAEMPHRKIVKRLLVGTADSGMATHFHGEMMTLCQGCHHQSQPSLKPPKCSTCHGQAVDPANPAKPGLMGAFHQQCMTCHEEMKLDKPEGCIGCHKERKKS